MVVSWDFEWDLLSGFISHMAGWKITEWRLLARKIIDFYGPLSSKQCLIIGGCISVIITTLQISGTISIMGNPWISYQTVFTKECLFRTRAGFGHCSDHCSKCRGPLAGLAGTQVPR